MLPPWVSVSFVFCWALHRSWKANSPKVNFLSFYKLTPAGCYSNCKASIMSCVNKPDSQCWCRAAHGREEGGGRSVMCLKSGSWGELGMLQTSMPLPSVPSSLLPSPPLPLPPVSPPLLSSPLLSPLLSPLDFLPGQERRQRM